MGVDFNVNKIIWGLIERPLSKLLAKANLIRLKKIKNISQTLKTASWTLEITHSAPWLL